MLNGPFGPPYCIDVAFLRHYAASECIACTYKKNKFVNLCKMKVAKVKFKKKKHKFAKIQV